jgi:Flp pilus assembly protein TadG
MKVGHSGRVIEENGGSTLVEFAFVLPLLAFILFAIIQYGFLFAAYITVRNASAVGARQALINPNATVVQGVATAAVSPMLDSSKATANLGTISVGGATAYQVTVSYPLKMIIPFILPPFNKSNTNRTLTASTVMR